MLNIGDIEKFSLVDWPGKMAVVVFLQGCPWRCPFCYNQSLQSAQIKGLATFDNLLNLLEHRKGMIDAVVFSGGEPLMQDNLPQAMDKVRAMGFAIGLHTGGFRPEMLQNVLNKVDWVGFDIKAPLNEMHYKKATGNIAEVAKIKESLQMLIESGINFECRTTCDPRLLDIDDIYKIGDELANLGVKEYYLQKYRPIPSDRTTQDSDCEKFFNDNELTANLRQKFAIFDIRK